MPGSTSGKVTRQKVIQPFSPRSARLPPGCGRNPRSATISTVMANGTQISDVPEHHRSPATAEWPAAFSRISSEMPSTMSGMNSGSEMKPSSAAPPGHAVARHRLGGEKAQHGGQQRGRPRRPSGCCPARAAWRVVGQQLAYQWVVKPVSGKAMNIGIVEREKRQQQHRHIEKGQIGEGVDEQPAPRLPSSADPSRAGRALPPRTGPRSRPPSPCWPSPAPRPAASCRPCRTAPR